MFIFFLCCILITIYLDIEIYWSLLFTILIFFIVYLLMNPTLSLVPYNQLIETLYDKKVFYTEEEKLEIFPLSIKLEKNVDKIKEELYNLLKINNRKISAYGNVAEQFIAKEKDFFKGWSTIPLKMFGKITDNLLKCPFLYSYLANEENIPTAFFSILEPGKRIPSHYGPFKGILRYHLSLFLPPKDSGDCFISVDNQIYEWKESQGVLFDETYKHFVINDTNYYRAILFLDVKRPLFFPLNLFNDFILFLMGISPYNFI
jgi:aspartyl/asparaginyl beta-hydroxylase (cupin superfamily)